MFNYTDTSDNCIKCGKCKPVCTIFNINTDETTSPRGFIDLLGAYERGELELDRNTKDIFESCFLCTNCTDVCPNSLPTDMIIEQVRYDIAKKYGIAWYKKAFFYLLRNRGTMDILAKLGYVFQTCALKLDKDNESSKPKFSLPIIKKDRLLPFAKPKTFLKKYPQRIVANNKNTPTVAVFIGCLGNYTYVNIGDSLVNILTTLDINIFIPKKQLCCGAPAYFTGDFETVDFLIKKNIEYFESFIDEVDAIIIPEATCSAMINTDWEHFLHDQPQWKARAKELSKKVFLATKWLNDYTTLPKVLEEKNIKMEDLITYHDPCHAKKMQGVYKEPRNLLSQNYDIKEMSDSNACCGFGGVTMQSEKYYLAKAVGETKAKMIEQTSATIVSAECSACRMQITDSLYQSNVENVKFKNPIELIWEALDK
jgi:glycolate oxidase iron-sulfur subunit